MKRQTKPAPKNANPTPDTFYALYYRFLIGFTITAVGQDEDGFHYFEATGTDPDGKPQTYRCEISQDEEGNGPGFLFGLPNPYDVYNRKQREGA